MITPSFGLTATERVLPKLALDFTTGALDSRVTFTRASIGTYVDSSGVLQTASVDEPRFDYNAVTGSCKGLLIEESRSSAISSWAYFNSTANSPVVTDSAGTAPDGTNTAREIEVGAAQTSGTIRNLYQYGVTKEVLHSFSAFVKNVDATSARLGIWDNGTSGSYYLTLDFSTNTISTSKTASWGGTSSMETLGNGWYRIMFSFSIPAAGGTTTIPEIRVNGAAGTSALVWGAQLELNGAFPTSFIPWGSSPRAADVATMTGTDFSDWFNASEGTLLAEASTVVGGGTTFECAASVDDGTSSNRIQLRRTASTLQPTGLILASGSASFNTGVSGATTVGSNQIFTVGLAYKSNNACFGDRGLVTATDTSVIVPVVTQMQIGNGPSLNRLNGHVSRISYYPTRLTNAEVQAFSKG